MAEHERILLKRPHLERLMRYYRFLAALVKSKTAYAVTSARIAEALEIDPTQVRKDMAGLSVRGLPRVGFDACEVCRMIRQTLGFDQHYQAVLVGVGHFGGAILTYPGFSQYGLDIVAAFDLDPKKVGTAIKGLKIRPLKNLASYVRRNQTRLAILATPVSVAQAVAERLVEAGVKAIWNFAPVGLVVPRDVIVRNEHILLGLAELAYHLVASPSVDASSSRKRECALAKNHPK